MATTATATFPTGRASADTGFAELATALPEAAVADCLAADGSGRGAAVFDEASDLADCTLVAVALLATGLGLACAGLGGADLAATSTFVAAAFAGTGALTGLAGALTLLVGSDLAAVACLDANFVVAFTGALLGKDFFATAAFFAAGLAATTFLAGAFLAGAFLAGAFLEDACLATTFLEVGVLATAFLAATPAFFAETFLGGDTLAAAFFAAGLLDLLAAFTAFFADFFTATCEDPHSSLELGKRAVIPCRVNSGNRASFPAATCKSCDRTPSHCFVARLQALD